MIFHPIKSPGNRKQQSSKQGERPGRGVEYRARAPGDQGERAAKAQASALETDTKQNISPA